MAVDFENKPLKDDDGNIIKTADGKPVLYKHFLNDLPDEEHDVYGRMTAVEKLAYTRSMGLEPTPELIKAAAKENESTGRN